MALLRRKGIYESSRVFYLSPDDIAPNPSQPRCRFDPDGLSELAASIREHGVLQPLTVRRADGGGYELVSGERRLRASRQIGLAQVPCILVAVDAQASSLLALVENLQRRDLDFWEEALALQRLITTFHLSQEEAARRLGKSQSAVANKLRLLKLDGQAINTLRDNGFTERHARALLRLSDPGMQQSAAQHVVRHGLTVARTEQYVAHLLEQQAAPVRRKPTILVRDVRFFLNTVTRGLSLMKEAGVAAHCDRSETADSILLTIRIPKQSA